MHFIWFGFGPPRVGVYRRGGGRVICDGLTMIGDERPQGSGDECQEARGDGDGEQAAPPPTLVSLLILAHLVAVAATVWLAGHWVRTLIDQKRRMAIKSLFFFGFGQFAQILIPISAR